MLSLLFSLSLGNYYPNMNGDVYGISNPNYTDTLQFSTEYSKINSSTEYFEVYSPPITSQYAMVYWTMMPPVDLPENIVKRFDGKKIAITGYEVDQVFKNSDGSETSVPITWAYNHHYEAYLRNSQNSFEKVNGNNINPDDLGQYNHGSRKLFKLGNGSKDDFESSLFNDNVLYFSEANGGEFRASFHGYPNGYAQLLNSPRYFNIQPMQIDTRNRDPKYINSSIFRPGIMPRNSAAPKDAKYSGLLECPCTTRINKTIHYNYNYLITGNCDTPLYNYQECKKLIPSDRILNVSSGNYPSGCSYYSRQNIGYYNSYTNTNKSAHCGSGNTENNYLGYFNSIGINVNISYDFKTDLVNITAIGPSDVWFGIAFDAVKMSDEPYSIIFQGDTKVFEQKLGNHGPGVRLNNTLNVISNEIYDKTRKIVLTRNGNIHNLDYFNFSNITSNVNMLSAVGSSPQFSYHKTKSTTTLSIVSKNGFTCVCNDGKIGKINGIRFQKNCMPEPRGDLLRQKNPTCFIETYQGGQSCCHHKWILLDRDQQQPVGDMTYFLKYRFYFQEYNTQKRMVRAYYQTEAYSGEYDVPKCLPGTPSEECIHSITARWQVRDMVDNRYIGHSRGFELIYAAPHCHAPMCIDVELYNADTGDLLCHVSGILGSGNSSKAYDETHYLKLNPCLWGQDRGLLSPQFLSWDTNLTSIKRCNSTNLHYGEMASWQMRGVVVN